MARGVNKVIIIGNLGQDPESRTFPEGGSITNISVATTERWKDKQTGEQHERTEWHRIVFNGRLAEIALQYLRKGGKVYVEGALRTRKWQDSDGKDRYSTEIMAREMQMLDARDFDPHYTPPGSNEMAAPAPAPAPAQTPAPHAPPSDADFDDDIPF